MELVESTGRCSLYASDRVVNPSTYYKSSDVVRDETTTGVTRRCSLSLKNTNVRNCEVIPIYQCHCFASFKLSNVKDVTYVP